MIHQQESLNAIEEARRQLKCVAPISWSDFEQAVYELRQTNPSVKGQALVELIKEAALKQWMTGLTCC
jgi:hypothetical protein